MSYVSYHAELESHSAGEQEIFADIVRTFTQMGEKVRSNEGRAMRVSHAKSTGLLKGELIIDHGLPAEFAQGIATKPRIYPVLARLAQGPGEILDDRISTHRGMALKLLAVEGERISESTEQATQDFVLEAGKTAFINADASKFLLNLRAGVSNAPHIPEAAKSVISTVARAINTPLEAVGMGSKTLAFFGHPPLHPLAETYFSQVPMRWGDYIAKIGIFPVQALRDKLGEQGDVDTDNSETAFRDAVVEHFANAGAEFELRVQLATDLKLMPIEDAATEWPEDISPYRRVARLLFKPQTAWSAARASIFDDRLEFRPANSLIAHRPIGQIMRARLFAYEKLAAFRSNHNSTEIFEPRSLDDLPD